MITFILTFAAIMGVALVAYFIYLAWFEWQKKFARSVLKKNLYSVSSLN